MKNRQLAASNAPPPTSELAIAVSVIIPVHNEADSLKTLHAELTAVFRDWQRSYEIWWVNDGSTDQSAALLDELAHQDPHCQVIHFRRNFGQTAALTAGIEHARGEILVPIDADLQNDPRDIPRLVEKLAEGYDVVSGWRQQRHDHRWRRRFPSQVANWLISTLSGVRLHDYGCSLKAYRREFIAEVRLYGEMHRFMPLYAAMQGARVTELAVNHRPRQFGSSKYGLERIYKVFLDLLLVLFLGKYLAKPIYIFGGFGLTCLALSVLPISAAIFFKIMPEESGLQKDFVESPLPVMAAVCILIGVLALLQGILAEMLTRTYYESQNKRPYSIRTVSSHSAAAVTASPDAPGAYKGELQRLPGAN